MKYTHKEIEADKYTPVGSLFMQLMDRDSMPPRVHMNREARARYDHSLPGTAFSIYLDETVATPLPSGRRHFPDQERGEHFRSSSANGGPPLRTGRAGTPAAGASPRRAHSVGTGRGRTDSAVRSYPDHLGNNLIPTRAESRPVRQKRHIAEPRGGSGPHDTPVRVRVVGGIPEEIAPTHCRDGSTIRECRRPHCGAGVDHLGLSSLVPVAEPPKDRPVPPPMVKAPRMSGIRMFPEKRKESRPDHRRGVKMVRAPPHWRSTTERQWDFLEIGVDANESPTPRYRNQSSFGAGPCRPAARAQSASPAPQASPPRGRRVSPVKQRWRGGRCGSAAPERRSYDIITGRLLSY